MSESNASPARTADDTRTYRRHVEETATALREQLSTVPSIALVLESGIGRPDEGLAEARTWRLRDLPHGPSDTEGSERTLSVGSFESTPLFTLEGALSLHEGVTPYEVAFPVRVLAEAGVETILFVNTAGSVDPVIETDSLVLATDHINFQGRNPLVGPNVDDWGARFPDMTSPYDPALRAAAEEAALRHGIKLHEGIYFAMLGPNAGTRAEYRMIQSLGANVVGTSTVPEVIAARHMGVQVLALSVVTEQCLFGEGTSSSDQPDASGSAVRPRLQVLFQTLIEEDMNGTGAKA